MKPRGIGATITATLLSAWMAFQPIHQARPAGVLGPVCVFIVVTGTVAGVVVVIRCCQPSFRCTSDPEQPGTNWCSTMTRMAAKSSGLVQAGPNFRSYKGCMSICATNVMSGFVEDEPDLVVEKSTDLLNWKVAGKLEMEWNGEIEWKDPYPPIKQCFYRVRMVEPEPIGAKK